MIQSPTAIKSLTAAAPELLKIINEALCPLSLFIAAKRT
jgi:hypothetical protein